MLEPAGAEGASDHTCDLQDDILRGRPLVELAGEVHANNLWSLEFPGQASHDVDSVRAADSDSARAEAASIGGVRVGADDHGTREGVVLEDDLVDDPTTRLPEANVVLGTSAGKKVVDLLIYILGMLQVGLAAKPVVPGCY